ncbi:serine/threonine receptor-like kinase NFP [Prunus dulcis]|uniref:serine/threonine receptor-like kinase NFP n=1 Tax=Prunus dulcis TaxID=3755 RepID=UPI001482D404|nr:serine/threonine receptor-like kinase NFP [Prunus dulcis]
MANRWKCSKSHSSGEPKPEAGGGLSEKSISSGPLLPRQTVGPTSTGWPEVSYIAFDNQEHDEHPLALWYLRQVSNKGSVLKKRKKSFKVRNYDPDQATQEKLLSGISQYVGKAIMYDKEMIMEATNDLDELCKIGDSMYKATMYGKVLAIKRTNKDVKEKLSILQKVNHVNLVNLMGISYDADGDRFLVYENAENGSLENWLFPDSEASSDSLAFLSWSQRIHIALDFANGLHYMHDHTQQSIVHWDVRERNILVDSNFKAKFANFSTARPVTNSSMPKVDVFAFGVLLLELLSGKRAMETKENGEVVMLYKDLREVLKVEEKSVERLQKWIDPKLENCYPLDGALSLAALATTCTQENAQARPSLAEVVLNLSVLAQSSPKTMHKFSTSKFKTDSIVEVVIPVETR